MFFVSSARPFLVFYLPVSLAHALGVRTFDVLLDDLFPPSPAQPPPKEALHFLYLTHFNRVLDVERGWIRERETVFGLPSRVRATARLLRAAIERTGTAGPGVRRQRPQFLL